MSTATPVAPARGQTPPARRPISDLPPLLTLKLGEKADWAAIVEDGVWIGAVGPNAVHKLSPSGELMASVALPGKPLAGLALGFGALWAPLCGDAPALAKIDLATERLVGAFPLPFVSPEGGVATGAGGVWLFTDDEGTLVRIDPETGAIAQKIAAPPGCYNPIYSDGLIWASQAIGAQIGVIDPARGACIATIPTPAGPRFIAAGHGSIFTLNQGDGSLTRIDAQSKITLSTTMLDTPGDGGDIAIAEGIVWTSVRGVPLSATDARTGALLQQWEGVGGDSLGVGHGAIWLIYCRGGEVSRLDLETALLQCRT